MGVLFAIYGFLWGMIELAVSLLSAGRKRSIGEIYVIRALKYFFLADVTFLFCVQDAGSQMMITNQLILAGILLLTYFIGKFQNNQNKVNLIKMMGTGLPQQSKGFNSRAELFVILFALIIFVAFSFFPEYASNPLSLWFYDSIVNIENTPIFGFIFKVIGFFFLINLINKMSSGFGFILSGEAFRKTSSQSQNNQNDDENHFDDFTEIQ